MKKTITLITVLFIAGLLAGCNETAQQTTGPAVRTKTTTQQSAAAAKKTDKTPATPVQVIVDDSPEARIALFKLAQQNPTIVDSKTGKRFFIMPVKPKSGVDYKIIHIKPDPNIDYKMIVAGDKAKTEVKKFRDQIESEISRQIAQDSTTK